MATLVFIRKYYQAVAVKILAIVVLAAVQALLWQYVQANANHLSQKRSQGRQITALQSRLAAAEQKQSEQQELREQLNLIVPPKNSVPQILDRLERLAVQQGVTLSVLDIREKTSQETEANPIPALPLVVSLKVSGSAVDLLRYLEAIEHASELTVVEQWSLTPQDPAATVTTAPYQLNVQVVFFLQAGGDGNESN